MSRLSRFRYLDAVVFLLLTASVIQPAEALEVGGAAPEPALSPDGKILLHALRSTPATSTSVGDALAAPFPGDDPDAQPGTVWQAADASNNDRFITKADGNAPNAAGYLTFYSFWLKDPGNLSSTAIPTDLSLTTFAGVHSQLEVHGQPVTPGEASAMEDGRDLQIFSAIPLKRGWNHLQIKVVSTRLGNADGSLAVRLGYGSPAHGSLILSAVEAPPNQDRVDLVVHPLFGDHMVLQRDKPDHIWGQAPAGSEVTLAINGQTAETEADATGEWTAELPAEPAGGPYDLTISDGLGGARDTLTLHDILLGDVWLMSGQSNMEHDSRGTLKPDVYAVENPAANDTQLRFFTVLKNVQLAPTRQIQGQWLPCTPDSMATFSAVGYFFGRELRRQLGVPIGLIGSYWGGRTSQAFTSVDALQTDPAWPGLQAKWAQIDADYPSHEKRYQEVVLTKWRTALDAARTAKTTLPMRPAGPSGGSGDPSRPGVLYNGMIAPLIPLSIKGIGWYQGESNADHIADALDYKTLFPTLIRDWRARWQQDLPFLFVQLASFRAVQVQPVETTQAWPYLRENQVAALSLPNTGMAIVLDNDDGTETIHPHDKITVGKRLANVALAVVYGKSVPFTGPLFTTMDVAGGSARLHFQHTDGGLQARNGPLTGFAIMGADGNFVWADAKMDGDTVVVSSTQVRAPVAVRYGWADNPTGNLENGAGLPASPFRTDIATPALPPTVVAPATPKP